MYIIKVAKYCKKRGDVMRHAVSAWQFHIDVNLLCWKDGPGAERETMELRDGDRVYIMDAAGNTIDKITIDPRPITE